MTDNAPRLTASRTFELRTQRIAMLLAELQGHIVDDHCGVNPENVNWGHVGSLEFTQARLLEILDHLKGE